MMGFMNRNYYYIVASLPELSLEDGRLDYTIDNFRAEYYTEFSLKDRKLIDLLYLRIDNINVLKLLRDKDAQITKQGVYSVVELTNYISDLKEGNVIDDNLFPLYLSNYITSYSSMTDDVLLQENYLATLYYEYAMNCGNAFVSSWFEFNLNINNILSALIARKYKWNAASYIVGNTMVSEALRTSNARDFGLSAEIDIFESLNRISEVEDLAEREKKIDLMKWEWMEDASFFNYFTIERIFVFLLKLEMIERWIALDKEKGNVLFRKLIDSLKNEVQIPAEFR